MGFGGFSGGRGVSYEIADEDLTTWGQELFGDPTRFITFATYMNPVCANDADAQVLYFPKSLHIPAGITLTPSNRCKGLIIYVNGHLKVDGTISMSARGASAAGADTPLNATVRKIRRISRTIGKTTTVLEDLYDQLFGTVGTIPAAGGGGGAQAASTSGAAGTAGTARKTGGGGSGCGYNSTSGAGGAGTSFSGGAGGGASYNGYTGAAGSSSGGAGGAGGNASSFTGGGAGNPGGDGQNDGATGTGGWILLVVRGNIYISSTGVISSNGSAGGAGQYSGGGGSGGGSVNIIHGGSYSNLGTVQANGGAGGSGYDAYAGGGAGGAGCITVEQLAVMLS
jgi:hypothetical protein